MVEDNSRGWARGEEIQGEERKLEKKKRVIIRFVVLNMLFFIC